MIKARYDSNGNIILDLKLIGTCGDKKVKVLMDTGFSGALAIPVDIGCEIGLESVGDAHVIVASGEAIPVPIFLGKVEIGDEVIECIYIVLPGSNEVLIGMEVIRDYNVQFHGAKRTISIKKAEAEAMQKVEEIEPTVPPTPPMPIPTPPIPSLAEEVPIPATPTDRMQTLKETLRGVVPR
jgi:clan AA aspartic protease